MEQPRTPDGCGRSADPPRDVQITLIRAPRGRRARSGGATRRLAVALVLLLATAAAFATTRGAHVDPPRVAAAVQLPAADTPRTPAIAAVYRYPLGCLGASLSSPAGSPASAGSSRVGPCWRYGVFITAILREVRRGWQLGLEAVSARCPVVSLPAAVRAQLVVCRRADG